MAVLQTARMTLRRVCWADVDDIAELNGDAEVMRYLDNGHPMTRERVVAEEMPRLLTHDDRDDPLGYWAADDRSGTFLGWFTLTPDPTASHPAQLGYRLRREAWGQGYATEGARAVLEHGFATVGLTEVWAETMAVNGLRHHA